MTHPLLTAAQERAREEFFGNEDNGTYSDREALSIAECLNATVASTWNLALEAAEGVVPKSSSKCYFCGTVKCEYVSTACPAFVQSDEFRAETLQALSKLKQ